MKGISVTKRRMLGAVSLFALAALAGICGWREEEKRAAERREAARMVSLQSDAVQKTEEERDEAQLYWELAREMFSDMLLEQESVERKSARKGHELFSDEWYADEYRMADPYRYFFLCGWYDGIQATPGSPSEQDLTYLSVEQRRAGDYEGYFPFSVWVKETDHGVELTTDFHQKMFQYLLFESSKEHYGEKAYLAGVSPSENWMEYVPLYELLGEPVVMVSVTEDEKLEPVFRDACERMYERQKQVSGELGQQVRFGAFFDTASISWRNKDDPKYREFEKDYWKRRDWPARKSTYDSYLFEKWDVEGYRRWLDRYGGYYPAYYLDFHTGYDAEKQSIFQEMCKDRDQYLEMWRAKEAAKKEKEAGKDIKAQEETGEDGQRGVWTVEKGDTLWGIARRKYGDGSLWRRIYDSNRDVIGEDGNVILPGQVLELP